MNPAPRHGGHLVADVLSRHGITHIFGQDSPEWVFSALDHDTFTVTVTRDERSAGFAADAVARLTGRPTVATGIHGPGFLNLLTALYEAREASSPVIALVSGTETTTKGLGAFQELDQVGVARDLVTWATRVERPDRIEQTIERGIALATAGRMGPVLIDLPNDVLAAPQPAAASTPVPPRTTHRGAPLPESVVDMLRHARRPVLLLGSAAVHSDPELTVRAAERFGAAVCVTALARGAFPETHPLFAGVCGFMSDREDGSGAVANRILRDADVVFALGTGLDPATTDGGRLLPSATTLIRLDVDAAALAVDRRSDVAMVGDLHDALRDLASRTGAERRDADDRIAQIAELWRAVRAAQDERMHERHDGAISPAQVFGALREVMTPRDILVCDAAYSSIWALSYLQQGVHFERTTAGRGAGTLGFGFPAAIGAARAFRGRRVFVVCGDGGFGFGWAELETAVRVGADITCVILNNSEFAYQRLWHELNGTEARLLGFADVRHDELARAVGAQGHRVDSLEAVLPALRASRAPGLSVVDIVTTGSELPPFRKERHVGK
ncbi:thiamine pyrophosphate-binding protein [Agromyces silvae]|uniref:thiamine pyrophosphate-binding protein n=1 Tax=Agromyces silvae TaxID=3388266 RepID=UPI00280B5BD3|nr:thiamine pyrophosphate-binding protein [Agromyces protaetiae]